MKTLINAVDVSDWCTHELFNPADSDLAQQIASSIFSVEEVDGVTVPLVPKRGMTVKHYADDGVTLLFNGFAREVEAQHADSGRAWQVACQDQNVRTFEAQIGTLNTYVATQDNDRNMVIAIFRAGLKQQRLSPSSPAIDDAIITANEPNWPNVRGTAFLSGIDFSNLTVKAAMDKLTAAVPNVYWSIGADGTVSYGLRRTLAPFALSTSPDGATSAADNLLGRYKDFVDRIITGDHRNSLAYTGAGPTTVTASDEVSYAVHGRILAATPVTNTSVPAALVKQYAYATLRTKRERRLLKATAMKAGLSAGQIIDVVNERLGDGSRPAPWLDLFFSPIAGRSASGQLAKGNGYRGRVLIQKVTTVPVGGGAAGSGLLEYALECGDNIRDASTALAVLAGAGT